MAEHDEVYDDARADRLAEMLRALAERIRQLDRSGQLLRGVPELLRLMGDARSEMFHYEVRSTYDTPEVAESRRIVDEAQRQDSFHPTTRRTTNHGGIARRNEALLRPAWPRSRWSGIGVLGYQLAKPADREHSGERDRPAGRYGRLSRVS